MRIELQSILIRNWLFGVLPGRVLADLSLQFSTKKYSPNQYVFHQDDEANHLYIILEGEVSIETINVEGKMTKIAYLNTGEIFGEFAVIDEKGRSASALVSKHTILASLPSRIFKELLDNHPEFARQLLAVLVTRLRGSNQQVESLVTMNLLQRTAWMIFQISEKTGPEINLTQTELAERLSASREKVNTKLKELESFGVIKLGHRKIEILSLDDLQRISESIF